LEQALEFRFFNEFYAVWAAVFTRTFFETVKIRGGK